MADMNRVMLQGFVGGPADVQTTSGGAKVAVLSVATNEKFKRRDGTEESKTTWHRVVCWGYLADAVADIDKGARVIVEGKIQYKDWEDKTGAKRTTTEIVAWSVSEVVRAPRADSRHEAQRSTPAQQSRRAAPVNADAFGDDEIPF